MKSERLTAEILNLSYTIESGQPLTFYGDYRNGSDQITYPVGGALVTARFAHMGDKVVIDARSSNGKSVKDEITSRFRLNDDIQTMYESISTDKKISAAIRQFRGMRVTKNEPWETSVCFIISQFNNLKRIRGIIKNMMERFGDPICSFDEETRYSFPSAEALSNARIEDIMRCGAGFRAKYIKSAAKYCTENLDLESISKLEYADLKEELMRIDGVGDKVADCIALMGYGKMEAFPVDVWVKRSMEKMYFKGKKKGVKDIHAYASGKWGEMAGFAQQYIFWYGRSNF